MTLPRLDVLRGTLDLLILRCVSGGEAHGYAVARWIERVTGQELHIEEGSLYPALYRLEDRDLVVAEWGVTENGRRAKYYRLTPAGRSALKTEIASWRRFTAAVAAALDAPAKLHPSRT